MEVDFSLIDLKELDLTMVFWEEVLAHGSSIQEEVSTQTWSFLYYSALDLLSDPDPSSEEEQNLHTAVDDYMHSEHVQTWIANQTQEMTIYLKK